MRTRTSLIATLLTLAVVAVAVPLATASPANDNRLVIGIKLTFDSPTSPHATTVDGDPPGTPHGRAGRWPELLRVGAGAVARTPLDGRPRPVATRSDAWVVSRSR